MNPLFVRLPSPLPQSDRTVPGTTEGILIMGLLIVVIILVPVLWRRRR